MARLVFLLPAVFAMVVVVEGTTRAQAPEAPSSPLDCPPFAEVAPLTAVRGKLPGPGGQSDTLFRWWTMGCPHCRASLPALARLAQEMGLGLALIYHHKGGPTPSDAEVLAYLQDLDIPAQFPVARDPDWSVLRPLLTRFSLDSATSVSFLVDSYHRVQWVHPGPRIHPDDTGTHPEAQRSLDDLRRVLAARAHAARRDVRVQSFNIRYDNPADGAHSWDARRDLLLATVRRFDADILALQEVLPEQRRWLLDRLTDYQPVGRGREADGTGEQTLILLRKGRFAVDAERTLWLSPTPAVPGSVGWDAALPRIAVEARVTDRRTSKNLVIINTHLDHRGSQARLEAAKLIRGLVDAAEAPVILLGDFNAAEGSEPHQALLQSPGRPPLLDTYRVSHPRASDAEGTFHGFGDRQSGDRIDWVLCSPAFEIQGADILRAPRGGPYPSDHNPVIATLRLP